MATEHATSRAWRSNGTPPNPTNVAYPKHTAEGLISIALTHREAAQLVADLPPGALLGKEANIGLAVADLLNREADISPRTVADVLEKHGLLGTVGGLPALLELQIAAPLPHHAGAYAHQLAAAQHQRSIATELHNLADLALAGDNISPHLAELLEQQTHAHDGGSPDPNIDEFLHTQDQDDNYDWVIPDIVERGDRTIITGEEGGGKSTLFRQIAVQTAAGIHPFTLQETPPKKVMLLDCENSERHVRRQLNPLHLAAGTYNPNNLHIVVKPEGIDLTNPDDQTWLQQRITANQPDLILLGPLYKLASGDPTDEQVAQAVRHQLDTIRTQHQTTILLEAHTPHAPTPGGRRPERPYGASLWLRWPEFGLYLAKDGPIRHWRGPRDERDWPTVLERGGQWPWTPTTTTRNTTFAHILDHTRQAGKPLSVRDLQDLTGASKTTVNRIIKANQKQYDDLLATLT